MAITKDAIQARLEQLRAGSAQIKQDLERLTTSLHATDGAIQDCEYWLSIATAESEPGTNPTVV